MKFIFCALLLPLLAHPEELKLQIRAKLLPLSGTPTVIEINSPDDPRPILLGIKVQERANLRVYCLGVERDVLSIKRLLSMSEDDCRIDAAANRISLANNNLEYVTHAALLEVPPGTSLTVLWNGKKLHEGPVLGSIVLSEGKAQSIELKGLDTLIVLCSDRRSPG